MFVLDGYLRVRISASNLLNTNCKEEYIRYFDNKSLVRRMMNFVTSPPSSLSFLSDSACTSTDELASRPRIIAFSKFFLKSSRVPRKLGLAKFRSEKYSERSF